VKNWRGVTVHSFHSLWYSRWNCISDNDAI